MSAASPARVARRWDLFCTVVDNLGDAAICWRLATQLAAEHGIAPRIWIDDPSALARLRPGAAPGTTVDGVRIEHLTGLDPRLAATRPDDLPEVVVGTLSSTLPDAYRLAMRVRRPLWIGIEYLSAEPWVTSFHGLPSPKPDGLVEHFFFPGFESGTGGLLRERDLPARRVAFGADPAAGSAFLASIGVVPRAGERLATLFCYADAPVGALLDAFGARPERWRVLVPEGVGAGAAGHPLAVPVPFVPQRDYDRLLWSADLNLVRGEESFVRALWAARPMVWQAYRQPARAQDPKVEAFVATWCRDAVPAPIAAEAFGAIHRAWNAAPAEAAALLPSALDALLDELGEIRRAAARWAALSASTDDLAQRLVRFAIDRL